MSRPSDEEIEALRRQAAPLLQAVLEDVEPAHDVPAEDVVLARARGPRRWTLSLGVPVALAAAGCAALLVFWAPGEDKEDASPLLGFAGAHSTLLISVAESGLSASRFYLELNVYPQ